MIDVQTYTKGCRHARKTRQNGIYTTRFVGPDGLEVRRSTRTATRRLAQEFEDRLRAEQWRILQLGDKPRRTWQEAAVEWLETHDGKDTIDKGRANLRWLHSHLGALHLDEIDEDLLGTIAKARRAEPADKRATAAPKTPAHKRRPVVASVGPPKRTSPATVNRMLSLIGAILRAARDDWKWIDRIPTVPKLTARKRDVPTITRELTARLCAELPEHLRPLFAFALAVGLCEQNVLRLRWRDVDIDRRAARILGSQTKAGESIPVPLNVDALAVLADQAATAKERTAKMSDAQRHVDPSSEWVFPSPRGVPYTRANNTAWRKARVRAGVPWLRWHDLRHAWASWHAQAGTPLLALMQLGGWASVAMVQKYASFATEHLADHADRMARQGVIPTRPSEIEP